jgi:hypothetical protein
MTKGANRFTTQEWSVVAGAPLLAAMWVLADTRGGMRATLAVASAYRDAAGHYDSELLRELLATAPADAIKRPRDSDALRREAPAALRHALDIVARWHRERTGSVPAVRPRARRRCRAGRRPT